MLRYCNRSGESLPFQTFPHSLASHLVAGNGNLALVKQALGHRSSSSTMVYVGTTDAQAAEAVQSALMGVFKVFRAWPFAKQ
ncbi:MAG TPA: hypothetical protein VMC85_09110 [Desulfomonilaceae bacterium]|nr:hypothetical protein [Desulfomonilaceae bacterium]